MQESVSQKGEAGVLVGVGAALAIILLLVLQAASSGATLAPKTTTVTETTELTAVPSSATLHKVTFNETGGSCGNGLVYANSWAVTLGNVTLSQPSNETFPGTARDVIDSAAYKMISTITFTVPDGTFNYNVTASTTVFPSSGRLNVNGSDMVVQLDGPEISCYGP